MPLNINRKLTNVELATRYFNLSMGAKGLFEKWLYTESDEVWVEYLRTKQAAETVRISINTRSVEAA